jgi:hypothetical protein
MPPSKTIPLAPGESIDMITCEGDRVVASYGLVVLCKPMRGGEPGELHKLERGVGRPLDSGGHWVAGNCGSTPAEIALVRMGPAYARLRRINKGLDPWR